MLFIGIVNKLSCEVVMFHVLRSCVLFDYVVNPENELDFVIRDFSPIQAGGNTLYPPYCSFPCYAETACSTPIKLSDF